MSASEPAPGPSREGLPAWVVVAALGCLTGLQPLSTDMYLPALPEMQRGLGMSNATAQWTLSVLIMAFGIGQLVSGPIADRFGRQPVLRWGLAGYVLASLMATVAVHTGMMLLARAALFRKRMSKEPVPEEVSSGRDRGN